MSDKDRILDRLVQRTYAVVIEDSTESGIEVLRAFARDGGNADLARAKVGERLMEGGYLQETVALLGGRQDVTSPGVLVVRGMARLGLGHYQPSAADFEQALFMGVDDEAVRDTATDGVVAALRALSVTRSDCPLYARKAEMYERQMRGEAHDGHTWERWVTGEWIPRESFGGVAFGEVLHYALLDCIRVLPDDKEERWCFLPPARIVIATDQGRLDLVNTRESVRYRSRDLIGLRREELEAILGPADAEEQVLDMLYLSFDDLDVDIVVEEGTTTQAVVTGAGLRSST